MSKKLYILFEGPTGYALFERTTAEEIGRADVPLQAELQKASVFSKWVNLVGFAPFFSPENALEECVCVTEGMMSSSLSSFLSTTLPESKKQREWELGVSDVKLGSSIRKGLPYIDVVTSPMILELMRCIRLHAVRLLPNHEKDDIVRAQCGLGHAVSRSTVKFNVHKNDNMVIQASALLEHMDKGVNLLGMRVKEWYGWHFPELAREVPDPLVYCKIVLLIGNRDNMLLLDQTEVVESLAALVEGDEALAVRIYEKAKTSMGPTLQDVDWECIKTFAERVDSLGQYRQEVQQYILQKMMAIAPNLTTLIGQQIGAKLITKAGSLVNLAKAPASTIQILGAEKALFRALKKRKGNTPKYGLIFHSSYIQRAAVEHRGKVSRYLANKAALASRIDRFLDTDPTTIFGEALKSQVDARLSFFESGEKPQPNAEVMAQALAQYEAVLARRKERRAKKKAREEAETAEAPAVAAPEEDVGKATKKRKKEVAAKV